MINQAKNAWDSAVPSLFPPFFAHSLFSVVSRLYISSALTVTPHWHRLSSVEANNFHMFFYFFMQFTVSLSTIQLHNVCDVNIFTIINSLCYNLANHSKKISVITINMITDQHLIRRKSNLIPRSHPFLPMSPFL